MIPVITKVPEYGRKHPEQNAFHGRIVPTSLNVEYGEVAEHEAPDCVLHEPGEIARRLAQNTSANTVDRIIAAVVSGALPAIDEKLYDNCKQEEWNGHGDQIHARMLTRTGTSNDQ